MADFYSRVALTATTFTGDATAAVDLGDEMRRVEIINEDGTHTVAYSFDKLNDHGLLLARASGLPDHAMKQTRKVRKLWLRIASGGAGPVNVQVRAYS